MEILGIGPSELIFIVIIAIIVLGPKDMQKTGRTIGKWLRQLVTSDGWKLFQQTSREIQTLPQRLMRQAALDELKEVERELKRPLETAQRPTVVLPPGTPEKTESGNSSARPEEESDPSPQTPTPGTPSDGSV